MNPFLRWMAALFGATFMLSAASAADAWTELAKPGAIVLFRHANAPGIGDPPGFRPGECASQRNLDERGRADARRLGEMFSSRKVAVGSVLSSGWCRAKETASLAFGGMVQEEPAFNSFFRMSADAREKQTAQARAILSAWRGPGALVVVTHQVNISALTGTAVASGEGLVVVPAADGSFRVTATITP
jgi:phosphohistidine phosphatase SixA